MTLKARALGMTSTTYVNASGLPAEEQITTARDQAVLGRAIQHRFPIYYRYFATPSFQYKGVEIRNHNALLGQVKGADGIKTGYTEASGYNLVSSVRRDEKHIVAVVLGGSSNAARDARMRQLIEDHISQASTQRTAPIIMELNGERGAHEGDEGLGAVAPGTRITEVPAGESIDATLAHAKVDPILNPKSRIQATKRRANASKQAVSSKTPPDRVQRKTANSPNEASILSVQRDATTSASRRTSNVRPKVGPSDSMSRHF
jgi:D-alanyl-D-alanine carboxypeptidase